MPALLYSSVWVTYSSQTVSMVTLPIAAYVTNVRIQCTEAFNSSGSDAITVGYTSDTDAFATSTDVSSTGILAVTLGSGIGYQTTSYEVKAYYTAGSSTPTTGRALVVLEYFLNPQN